MRVVALIFFFVPVSVFANEEPASFLATPLRGVAVERVATTNPSTCEPYLSTAARQAGGATHLAVHITTDGSVSDSHILESSGRGELDRAALHCVGAMHLAPRTRDGFPVDVDWQLEVDWPAGSVRTAPIAGSDYACNSYYPPTAQRAGREGDTLVSYVIGPDGSVSGASITESSGDRELDDAALACVSRFRYHPAMREGKPVEVDGKFFAMWRIR